MLLASKLDFKIKSVSKGISSDYDDGIEGQNDVTIGSGGCAYERNKTH